MNLINIEIFKYENAFLCNKILNRKMYAKLNTYHRIKQFNLRTTQKTIIQIRIQIKLTIYVTFQWISKKKDTRNALKDAHLRANITNISYKAGAFSCERRVQQMLGPKGHGSLKC